MAEVEQQNVDGMAVLMAPSDTVTVSAEVMVNGDVAEAMASCKKSSQCK